MLGREKIMEKFSNLQADVFVVPEDFKSGDSIRGHWSSHSTGGGAKLEEEWYEGKILRVRYEDEIPYYEVRWDDGHNSRSQVHCVGAVWRTFRGGVIYAMEKI